MIVKNYVQSFPRKLSDIFANFVPLFTTPIFTAILLERKNITFWSEKNIRRGVISPFIFCTLNV